jgi:hypothetical protein
MSMQMTPTDDRTAPTFVCTGKLTFDQKRVPCPCVYRRSLVASLQKKVNFRKAIYIKSHDFARVLVSNCGGLPTQRRNVKSRGTRFFVIFTGRLVGTIGTGFLRHEL